MKDLRQYITNCKPSSEEESKYSFILRYCKGDYALDDYTSIYQMLSDYMDGDDLCCCGYGESMHHLDMGLSETFHIEIIIDALFANKCKCEAGSVPVYNCEEDRSITDAFRTDLRRLVNMTKLSEEEKQEIIDFVDDDNGDATYEYLFVQSKGIGDIPWIDEITDALGCRLLDNDTMMGLWLDYYNDFQQVDYERIIEILENYYTQINLPENATLIAALNSFNWEYPIMNTIATAIKNTYQTEKEVLF